MTNWNEEIMAIETNGHNHYLAWVNRDGVDQEADGLTLQELTHRVKILNLLNLTNSIGVLNSLKFNFVVSASYRSISLIF